MVFGHTGKMATHKIVTFGKVYLFDAALSPIGSSAVVRLPDGQYFTARMSGADYYTTKWKRGSETPGMVKTAIDARPA